MSPTINFNGPAAKTFQEFTKGLESMPAQYSTAFNQISHESVKIVCNKTYLHVWECDSDIDNLLQLTQVIVKIRHMTTYVPQATSSAKNVPAGMIIIAEASSGRDNFGRICELVKYLIGKEGHSHLNGGLMSFAGIKVVRGVDNSQVPDAKGQYATKDVETGVRKAVERVNKAITRALESGAYPNADVKRIIWHHGSTIHWLNYWINNTTNQLRSALKAITITSTLSFPPKNSKSGASIRISSLGRNNTPEDFQRLESYLKKLGNGVFAVFSDPTSQLIEYTHLNTYMYFYSYYISTWLPGDLPKQHFHRALDTLVTYCFRLRNAAIEKKYGEKAKDMVTLVQNHLTPANARPWAKDCISAASYADKAVCQAMAKDGEIHTAVQLADSPFKLFVNGVPAFARLTFGPAADLLAEHYICAPVSIAFGKGRDISIKAANPSPFRLWLPKPGQDVDMVTQRIRGVMIAVLELVRKGEQVKPHVTKEARQQWDEAVKACVWALEGCKGKYPKGVEEKVTYVEGMLKKGTWAFLLGVIAQQQAAQSEQAAAAGQPTGTAFSQGPSWTGEGGIGHTNQDAWTGGGWN